MNKIFFIAIAFLFLTLNSCKDDDDTTIDYQYHAHIHSPSNDDVTLNDSILIEVDYESHTGQPVHHINVSIYKKGSTTKIYNKPTEAHIHDTSGAYTYEDTFVASTANGFEKNAIYILEAKVWGENDGEGEESSTVEFTVK